MHIGHHGYHCIDLVPILLARENVLCPADWGQMHFGLQQLVTFTFRIFFQNGFGFHMFSLAQHVQYEKYETCTHFR